MNISLPVDEQLQSVLILSSSSYWSVYVTPRPVYPSISIE